MWTELLLFSVELGDTTKAQEACDRALGAVGSHVRDGDVVWQAVLMVETQVGMALVYLAISILILLKINLDVPPTILF